MILTGETEEVREKETDLQPMTAKFDSWNSILDNTGAGDEVQNVNVYVVPSFFFFWIGGPSFLIRLD